MVSGSGGHIPFQVGCDSNWQYKYCTLWADHYSKFLYGHLQEAATSKETIFSKETYKTYTTCFDVRVKHVHSNNGVFTSADNTKHLDIHGQHHSLCGISAHWQNGMVEHYIGIITSHAQTMLLHTMSTWPEIITSKFWSFAVKHIIWLHNMKPIPAKNNQCPSELFTGKAPPHHISNFCIFGCPAYILKKNLADDNSIPKWKAQAYRGIFIGHSKQHSSSVATHQQNWFQPNITYFLTKALKQ